MKHAVLLAIMVLMAGLSSAWGSKVTSFICEKAVGDVWGEGVVKDCIPKNDAVFLQNFCEVNSLVLGADNYEKCKKAFSRNIHIHPALISAEVLMDESLHYDYMHCPIIKGSEKWWICGDSSSRPAIVQAEKWFTAAEGAPDTCTRVYDFCVAASYYADSESELHQVNNFYNDCQKVIEDAADNLIGNNLSAWSAGETCRFREGAGSTFKDYKQRLGVSSNDVQRAVNYLVERGKSIEGMPLHPKNSVIILANSIDHGLAQGLYDYIANSSADVHFSAPEEFNETRYNPKVIILGGQNAPEGVGEVVSTILSRDEMDSLTEKGVRKVYVRKGVWKEGQTVIIVAGNEKEDTQSAWMENKERILSEISKA